MSSWLEQQQAERQRPVQPLGMARGEVELLQNKEQTQLIAWAAVVRRNSASSGQQDLRECLVQTGCCDLKVGRRLKESDPFLLHIW